VAFTKKINLLSVPSSFLFWFNLTEKIRSLWILWIVWRHDIVRFWESVVSRKNEFDRKQFF
jgi:hypothetical protein